MNSILIVLGLSLLAPVLRIQPKKELAHLKSNTDYRASDSTFTKLEQKEFWKTNKDYYMSFKKRELKK